MSLFQPYVFTGQRAQLRFDPNAGQLMYATPGMIFPDLGMNSSVTDISPLYRGGGTYPTSLTAGQPVSGSSMNTTYGSKWLNEGYRQSTILQTNGALLARLVDARLNFGASNFTLETWFYPTSTTTRPFYNNYRSYNVTTTQFGWFTGAGTVSIYISIGGSEIGLFVGQAWSPTLNAWNHVAFTRNGNVYNLWLNGNKVGTDKTQAGTLNANTTWVTYIGNYNNNTANTQAYQDTRIYNGVAKYTAAFTPPPNMVIAP